MNRKWLYTAVTRATDLSNVFFYGGADQGFDVEVLNKYLDNKIVHYVRQDKQAGRKGFDNYVNRDWFMRQYGKSCSGCGDCLTFEIKGNKVESNLTADRLDNDETHRLNNIVPLCVSRNQRKSQW